MNPATRVLVLLAKIAGVLILWLGAITGWFGLLAAVSGTIAAFNPKNVQRFLPLGPRRGFALGLASIALFGLSVATYTPTPRPPSASGQARSDGAEAAQSTEVNTLAVQTVSSPTATPRPTGTPPPTPTPRPGMGTMLQTRNWKISLDGVERPGTNLVWSKFGNASEAVGEFVVVYLTLENIGRTNFSVNSWDFELKVAGNVTYKTASCCFLFADSKGMLGLGHQMPPGVPAQAPIIFDVAPNAADLRLVFLQDGGRTWFLE